MEAGHCCSVLNLIANSRAGYIAQACTFQVSRPFTAAVRTTRCVSRPYTPMCHSPLRITGLTRSLRVLATLRLTWYQASAPLSSGSREWTPNPQFLPDSPTATRHVVSRLEVSNPFDFGLDIANAGLRNQVHHVEVTDVQRVMKNLD